MIFLIFAVRLVALCAAGWGVIRRDPRIHAPAALVLIAEVGSLWPAFNLLWDPRAYIAGGPLLIWFIAGPFIPMSILFDAATLAPIPVMASLVVGAVVGLLVWRLLWRRSQRRLWTVISTFAGLASAVVVLEIGVEATMRADAARTSHSCGLQRTSVIDMMINGGGSYARERHGELRDGATVCSWSFRQGGWIQRYACAPDNSVSCSCRD